MHIAHKIALAGTVLLPFSLSAFAGVTVNSPVSNTEVTSPFKLSASASVCSNRSVISMGYSFDGSSDTTVFKDQSIEADVDAAAGAHVLHIKAWGGNGTSCVKDINITIKAGASAVDSSASTSDNPEASIPSNADTVSHIQALGGWRNAHDTGGPGSSNGSTSIVSSPSLYGSTRRFVTSYSNGGDERYSIAFSDNVDAKNFFYDVWIYLTSSSNKIGNLEFDTNPVMPNGQTVLIGVQCDGYTGHWAYTVNKGTAKSVHPSWVSSNGTSCNPRSWSQNKWHHVQASFSRDDSGHITYHSVWLDGVESKLNARVFGAADLGWGPVINTQFQVDGLGSGGTVTTYVDNLTISAW